MAAYRILSIDGGGIRGIIPAIVLERLCAQPSLHGWLDRVDLVAGTSTGGLLALGIAAGLSPSEIREIYETKGRCIFSDSLLDDVCDFGNLRGADYGLRHLRRELRRVLGRRTLGELKKHVVITAFDLDDRSRSSTSGMGTRAAQRTPHHWRPKIFHNLPTDDNDAGARAYRVALYTCAAPTYFPSVDGYIDGGVFAPNPSVCALAQCQNAARRQDPPSSGANRSGTSVRPHRSLSRIVLLSLGTGMSLRHIAGDSHDWGYLQWARPLLRIMIDGASQIADHQCRQFLGPRYFRLAPVFPTGINPPMDAAERLPYMAQFARELDLGLCERWIRARWLRAERREAARSATS